MAWGKELTKEDLIKAGLNPDDLAEMKANGVKKADLDTLKSEMSTSVAEAIKNGLADLETRLGQPRQRTDEQQQQQQQQQDKPDEQTEFLTDPTAFVNKKIGQSVAFTAIQTTKMRMELAMDRAKASNPLF